MTPIHKECFTSLRCGLRSMLLPTFELIIFFNSSFIYENFKLAEIFNQIMCVSKYDYTMSTCVLKSALSFACAYKKRTMATGIICMILNE